MISFHDLGITLPFFKPI